MDPTTLWQLVALIEGVLLTVLVKAYHKQRKELLVHAMMPTFRIAVDTIKRSNSFETAGIIYEFACIDQDAETVIEDGSTLDLERDRGFPIEC
jgi:hypothetical protein